MRRLLFQHGRLAAAVTLAVTFTAIGLAAYSLARAHWVDDSWGYAGAVWFGALCGAALGVARFRSGSKIAYSLVLALMAAGQAAGQVLPSPASFSQTPASALIWGMHVRTLTLLDRVASWAGAAVGSQVIRDNGLFVFLMVVILWQAGAWLTGRVLAHQRALAALLPLGTILAISDHLSGRPSSEFGAFLVCGVLLMAHLTYARSTSSWGRRRVDYPESITVDWGFNTVQVTVVVGVLVLAAPLFGTPAGWRFLGDMFKAAQQQGAQTASRLFSGVNPPKVTSVAFSARTPDLSRIGNPLPSGDETVMWVSVSDPAPPPPEAGVRAPAVPVHYWRSQVFVTYTGSGWEPLEVPPPAASPETGAALSASPPPGRYRLWQRFFIVAEHGQDLFAVNAPVTATLDGVELQSLGPDLDSLARGPASTYEVTSLATNVRGAQLAAAPTTYPPDIQARYLQLPAELPERVRQLAERITAGAPDPAATAARIQEYLRANYTYQLDPPETPSGQDAVDHFLFDAPVGFCSHFASAMTVLLRARGVPARVATGFAMGDYDYDRNAYRVTVEGAHAWVEVYFPGLGWVEYEPTVARAAIDYGGASAPAIDQPPTPPAPARSAGWLVELVILVVVGAAGISAWLWWRARRRMTGSPISRRYWQIRGTLARAGLSAPPSATPNEFLTACAPALLAWPLLWAATAHITRLYVQAAYSPHPAPAAEALAADRMWQDARPERWRLWLSALGRRLAARIRARAR